MYAWHIVNSDGGEINTTGTAKLFPMACTTESEARQWIQTINQWCADTRARIEELEIDDEAPGALPVSSTPGNSPQTAPRKSSFRRQSIILHDASLERLQSTSPSRKTDSQIFHVGLNGSPREQGVLSELDVLKEGAVAEREEFTWRNLSQYGGQQRRRNSILNVLEESNRSVRREDGSDDSYEFWTADGSNAYDGLDLSQSTPGSVKFGTGLQLCLLAGWSVSKSSVSENPQQFRDIELEAGRVESTSHSTLSTRLLCLDTASCTFRLIEPERNIGKSPASLQIASSVEPKMERVCKIIDSATIESAFGVMRSSMILPQMHVLEPLRKHMQLIYDIGVWGPSDEEICGIRITESSTSTQALDEEVPTSKNIDATETRLLKISKEWCSGGSLRDLIHWTRGDSLDAMDVVRVFSISLMNALARNHNAGFVHGAMRLSNIFLASQGDPTSLRVGGLCVSRWMREHVALKQPVDSPGTLYLAPEEVETKEPSDSASVDIWQAGVMMLQIALMEDWESECKGDFQPVKPEIVYEYLDRLREGVDPNRPNRIVALIKRCLDSNPSRRPTALDAQKLIIGATDVTLARQEMHAAMVDEMLLTVELEEPLGEGEEFTDELQLCSSAGLSEIKVMDRRSTEPILESGITGIMTQSQNSYHKRKKLGARSMSSNDPNVEEEAFSQTH